MALQANAIWLMSTVSSWSLRVVMRYSVSEWNSLSRSPPLPGVVLEKFAMAACVLDVVSQRPCVVLSRCFLLLSRGSGPDGCWGRANVAV